MTKDRLYIQNCGIATPIGSGKQNVAHALFAGSKDGISTRRDLISGETVLVGAVKDTLPELPPELHDLASRNNRLMLLALSEITSAVAKAISLYGPDRIAVVLGTSTSGIASGEDAFETYTKSGSWPADFHYEQQELTSLSAFVSRFYGLTGPCYTIATACSSSAKVFASARRLIHAGLADAVITGGADTICRMTLNGFGALELLSKQRCNPFSVHRDGITIGEGASAFLVGREEAEVELLGVGESSDAYHMTAPEPAGKWAQVAMLQALEQAGLEPDDIAYINLHGTGTVLNDAMEANGVAALFGDRVACSSTKGMTAHMLGATGGCEAAFLWLTLHPAYNPGLLPPHLWDGAADPALPPLRFVEPGMRLPQKKRLAMLSNSFGFGGSNASVIFGRVSHDA